MGPIFLSVAGLLLLPAALADQTQTSANQTEINQEAWLDNEAVRLIGCKNCTEELDWMFPAPGDCSDMSDVCQGTDKFCGSMDKRLHARCLRAHKKGPWLPPRSESCDGSLDQDERCTGTEPWCRLPAIAAMYGSSEECLAHRDKKLGTKYWGPRTKSLAPGTLEDCGRPYSEQCLGTEAYCGEKGDDKAKCRCFEQRLPLPFHIIQSKECSTARNDDAEPCKGSKAWCTDEKRIRIWGSQERCLEFRTEPPKDKALYYKTADGNCKGKGDEECLGTEYVCMLLTGPDRQACFDDRLPLHFLKPYTKGCTDPANEDERCVGTMQWCTDEFEKRQYLDPEECFAYRSFDHSSFVDKAKSSLKPAFKKAINRHVTELAQAELLAHLLQGHGEKRVEETVSEGERKAFEGVRQYADALAKGAKQMARRAVDNMLEHAP